MVYSQPLIWVQFNNVTLKLSLFKTDCKSPIKNIEK